MSEIEETKPSDTETNAEIKPNTELSSKEEEVIFGENEDGCNISVDIEGDIIVRCNEPKKEIRVKKGEAGTATDISERFT